LKVSDLKRRIARGEYEIDSAKVAEAIITKMRTVRTVRADLAGKREGGKRSESKRGGRFTLPSEHVAASAYK
jgi:hypothetical protein